MFRRDILVKWFRGILECTWELLVIHRNSHGLVRIILLCVLLAQLQFPPCMSWECFILIAWLFHYLGLEFILEIALFHELSWKECLDKMQLVDCRFMNKFDLDCCILFRWMTSFLKKIICILFDINAQYIFLFCLSEFCICL